MATPYMGLVLPVVGVTPGPQWAYELNAAFAVVDLHNHTPGFGAPITTAAFSVDADLPFNTFNATTVRSVRFSVQASPLALPSDVSSVYSVNGDLYYNNSTGFPVQITQGNALDATSIGGIGGDYATSPASVFYTQLSATFTFWQNANQWAKMDVGPVKIHDTTVGANGITISSPPALGADYGLTLPGALPASNKFFSVDSAGNMAFNTWVDDSSIELSGITSGNLRIKALGITNAMIQDDAVQTRNILALNVTTAKLDNLSVTTSKLGNLSVSNAKIGIQAVDGSNIINDVALNGNVSTTGTLTAGTTLSLDGGAITLSNYTPGGGDNGLAVTGAGNGKFYPGGTASASLDGSYGSQSVGIKQPGGPGFPIMVSENPGGSQALRFVRGGVNGNGTAGPGEGFTSARVGGPTGQYRVTYNSPFSGTPIVVTAPSDGFNRTVSISAANALFFDVNCVDAATNILTDTVFNFHAVGPV